MDFPFGHGPGLTLLRGQQRKKVLGVLLEAIADGRDCGLTRRQWRLRPRRESGAGRRHRPVQIFLGRNGNPSDDLLGGRVEDRRTVFSRDLLAPDGHREAGVEPDAGPGMRGHRGSSGPVAWLMFHSIQPTPVRPSVVPNLAAARTK